MSSLITEFQEVFQLYLRLGEKLAKILNIGDSQNPQALAESILQNRDCLVRIEQMNLQILQLSSDWEKCRETLDSESRGEICKLAEAAKSQAIRLKELCNIHSEKLKIARDKLGKDLSEIGKGVQYLKTIKPVKNNYPKFVDSLY